MAESSPPKTPSRPRWWGEMPRKRRDRTSMHLPARVHAKNGAYHYDLGRDEAGKRRWVKLCRISDGDHALYKALAELTKPRVRTLGDLFDSYLGSRTFAALAPRTQKDYLFYINGNLRAVFGETDPADVTSGHIAQYLQRRLEAGAGGDAKRARACPSQVSDSSGPGLAPAMEEIGRAHVCT